ncbi:hypothetical protein [Rhodoferax sp. GW822-FHT02A01]|uniref:hypothetical protein n=1 Tax=Rhodoferax sp. GW822-FHT02A01 TaxID=3141537 RepID=UPI00315CB85E
MATWFQRYRLVILLGAALLLVWLNLSAPAPGSVVSPTSVVAAVVRPDSASRVSAPVSAEALSTERPALELNDKDPFAPELPKPAPPPVVQKPVPVVAPPPPPPPEPPPLNMVYAGRMTTPDGTTVVYMATGDTTVALTPGLDLPNGYKVLTISERAVEFSYPALGRTTRLDLPPAQKYQTR